MQSIQPHLQAVDQLDHTKLEWYKGFRRPITEILADLSKPIPAKYLAQRKQGGTQLTYLPWHTCCKLLDRCCPGWDYSITNIHTTPDGPIVAKLQRSAICSLKLLLSKAFRKISFGLKQALTSWNSIYKTLGMYGFQPLYGTWSHLRYF